MAVRKRSEVKSAALSRNRPAKASRGCLIVFFSIFFLVGMVALYFLFLKPVMGTLQARSWPEVPCVVESSSVEVSHGEDSDTYRVKVVFRYEFEGRPYRSERYSFSEMSTSGRASKAAVVRQYPPGRQTVCYVDPNRPDVAVINREFTNEMWFGLFPLIFIIVGGGGILGAAFYRPKEKTAAGESWLPSDAESAPQAAGYHSAAAVLELKPQQTRVGRFAMVLFFSVIWNGIVGVFAGFFVNSLLRGEVEWILGLILIPFVLIGLLLLVLTIHSFLAMFNPRPTVTLLRHPVILGETLVIRWQFQGRTSAIRHLKIHLEGQEQARYQRGTTTHTDTHTFARLPLVDQRDAHAIASGSASLTIPARTMHSFHSSNNQILWSICVAGDIAWWPDVDERFPVVVQPPVVLDTDSDH